MEKLNRTKRLEQVEMSPEIKDLLERCKFALPEPGFGFGLEGKVNSKISEGIINHDYDVIIAEDASGRLPGLLIYETMSKLYSSDEEKQALKLFFMAGSKDVDSKGIKEDKISDYVKNTISEFHSENKKFLVVTDVVMEGESLKPLASSLKKLGIKYDILTLGIGRTFSFHSHGNQIYRLNEKLGSVSDGKVGIPDIFDKRKLSGVVKDPNEILSSRAPDNDMAQLGKVRDEIKVAAEELYERMARFNK